MRLCFVVAGTDTGVGKTVFSAALTAALDGRYWKPIQAGLEDETDSEVVRRLGRIPTSRIHGEAYRLALPASPNIAAAFEGVTIRTDRLTVPEGSRPLIIEAAGGLLVPLSATVLQIEVFASWNLPIILCARTALGTINHTLLSVEAMTRRNMKVHGIVFIGDAADEAETTIAAFARVPRLGRLPFVEPLNADSLMQAFRANFRIGDFAAGTGG